MEIPFFRVSISEAEADEVARCLRSGWLTTGPRVHQFESAFCAAVRAQHGIAVNSCTAAMHLAVEALGLQPGMGVLVPTMTFAATAEVVRYQGAIPILVDCVPGTLNMDLNDAERKMERVRNGSLPIGRDVDVRGIMPVHVGGLMVNMDDVAELARRHDLWTVEDAAHAFPAAYQTNGQPAWRQAGERTASVTCFSFYANKTMTTGEGGMAVTDDQQLADRMRCMSLHGLSKDAWNRFRTGASWDYKIVAPGFKYNLTDIAAAIGIHQLERAEEMRKQRAAIARFYIERMSHIEEIELPPDPPDRVHAWHLFSIRLHLDRLAMDRNAFIQELNRCGIGTSVHWRPLHLHPYYVDEFGWNAADFPVATREWERLVSLPLFPGMETDEMEYVVKHVAEICFRNRKQVCTRG
jgi:dTDP-4-amino-4,6-dideoxygalactose transaminase